MMVMMMKMWTIIFSCPIHTINLSTRKILSSVTLFGNPKETSALTPSYVAVPGRSLISIPKKFEPPS